MLDLDVWRSTPQILDLHLNPSHIPLLSRFIPPGTSFAPFITDLSTLTQPAVTTNGSWDLGIDTSFHNAYHSLEDIYSFGDALVAGFDGVNGVRVEGFSVGETFEGRKIRGWKAWYEPAEGSPEFKRKKGKKGKGKKPDEGDSTVELEFVVQSGQHAREVSRRERVPLTSVGRSSDCGILVSRFSPGCDFKPRRTSSRTAEIVHL